MNSGPAVASTSPDSRSAGRDERWFVMGSVAVLVMALLATTVAIVLQRRAVADPAGDERRLADFELIERSGRTVSRDELTNQFVVVGFVFTSCSLTCLEVSKHLAEVQRLTEGRGDVRLMSVTVDPRTDTPEVLRDFADRFGADPERWWFVTGPKAGVHELIATSFLDREPPSVFNPIPGGFRHTERVLVVDRQGRVRASFDGLKNGLASQVTEEIRRLSREEAR